MALVQEKSQTPSAGNSYNILLIEDNPQDARLVVELLKRAEIDVYVTERVATLDEARKRLESQSYDAVLLDMELPDGLGLDFLPVMKERTPQTPVILFTGRNERDLALRVIRAGGQDYLVKGRTNSEMMERAIRYSIERKKIEVERERLVQELQEALIEVKTLSGLLPICAWCKKVRDDEGYYHQIESYITARTEARFSHGICPTCLKERYSDYFENEEGSPATGECTHEH